MRDFTTERAQRIVETVAPGHRLVSVTPAPASFTNDARIFNCRTPAGSGLRLVVKPLGDDPVTAPRLAAPSFYALRLVRAHGLPAPPPVHLDETAATPSPPGHVTRFG